MEDWYWQTDAYGKTVEDAVDEFCDTYWDKPRKHTKLKSTGCGGRLFRMTGGVATYWIRMVDNIPTVYRITKYERKPMEER